MARQYSLILTTDYRVPDPSRVWPLLQRRVDGLAALGAHHLFLYTSVNDPGRVLVTIALHTREPVAELLRSRGFFEWFDAVGVEDLPAVFAGELIERFDLVDGSTPAGVVVAGISVVDDPAVFLSRVHQARELFAENGIRRMWAFEAFDDVRELMFFIDVADEDAATRWMNRPETAAEWFSDAGVGAYPPVFVGTLANTMRIGDNDDY